MRERIKDILLESIQVKEEILRNQIGEIPLHFLLPLFEHSPCLRTLLSRYQILMFDTPPEPFNKDVIQCPATPIHADTYGRMWLLKSLITPLPVAEPSGSSIRISMFSVVPAKNFFTRSIACSSVKNLLVGLKPPINSNLSV